MIASVPLSTLAYHFLRIFLGLVFLSSGIGKFYGTSGIMGPGWLFERLTPHGLLGFAQFIATAQIIIGFSLLVRRLTTAGAIMLVPLLLNILVVVVSLHWQGTPAVVGVFLAMNAYLLYHDRNKWLPVLGISPTASFSQLGQEVWPFGLALLAIVGGVWWDYISGTQDKWLMRIGLVLLLGLGIWRQWGIRRK